jgi:hypothetical protein
MHNFVITAYKNSPHIRQLARHVRPLPAARQLSREQLVFECGLNRASVSSVKRNTAAAISQRARKEFLREWCAWCWLKKAYPLLHPKD